MILAARFTLIGSLAIGAMTATSLGVVAPASAATTTTINLQVTGCEGCVFVAHRPKGHTKDSQLGMSTAVNNGSASLVVRTKTTSKMSLEVQHPLANDGNSVVGKAVSFVVIKYDGFKVGKAVPPASAAKQKQGALCWAGTSKSSATFNIQVQIIPAKTTSGPPRSFLRAYASPGMKSLGSHRLYRGVGGVDGFPSCNSPT